MMSFEKAAHLQYIEDFPLRKQMTRCHGSGCDPWCLCIPCFPSLPVSASSHVCLVSCVCLCVCVCVCLLGRGFLPLSTYEITSPAASHLIIHCLKALVSPLYSTPDCPTRHKWYPLSAAPFLTQVMFSSVVILRTL